jgi:hypothetical protein
MTAACLVAFASLNQVALLKRALERQSIYVAMVRTPRHLVTKGCGFAVRCGSEELPRILETCRTWGLEPGGVFEEADVSMADVPRTLSEEELEG